MRTMLSVLMTMVVAALVPAVVQGQERISEKTAGLQKIEGFVPLYWDSSGGRLLMEIGRFDQELLYQVSLPAGVGSNPIGLDRGQLGDTRVIVFERIGPKVLMVEQNYRYRALTSNEAERRAVEESFARSVLWGFKVEAADGNTVLVDATAFFLRDAHGVVDRLRQTKQGRYHVDETRSALHLARTKGFPGNTEVEATLTFTTDEDPGSQVTQTTPMPQAITVRQHHSFVELPPLSDEYEPRRLDPRVGVFGIEFHDYASPITEPIEKRWINRHRLRKADPAAGVSDAVEPIVYYVDPGAPEPIRSALVDGARWWSEAFESAGFRNAFRVEILPEGADPMDVRYNMIHWVHRSTRGWSYGYQVADPRTGEILKGNVSLGSLRVRQDFMIGTGLVPLGAAEASTEGCGFALLPEMEYLVDGDPATDVAAMSLARLRQLSAHEVGHTLGLAHNFAASAYGRESVMDYPAPLVDIVDGKLSLANAYDVGIGEYDKLAIRYAYSDFPAGTDETAALERIVRAGMDAGLLFIDDAGARAFGTAHPFASLWDNGRDPVAMLRHEMNVRRIALDRYGLPNLPEGTPLSMLEAKLVPLLLHHRFQLMAAAKLIGGLTYSYAVKSGGAAHPALVAEIVPAARQRDALTAVLATLDPKELVVPTGLLPLLPPRAFGYDGVSIELFSKHTTPAFDAIGASAIAADLVLTALLIPERAARLVEYHARDRSNPHFQEVIDALIAATWQTTASDDSYVAAVRRAVQSLTVSRVMDLAANEEASAEVRAVATQALRDLSARLARTDRAGTGEAARIRNAHRLAVRDDIERFITRPEGQYRRTTPLPTPAGEPIGGR